MFHNAPEVTDIVRRNYGHAGKAFVLIFKYTYMIYVKYKNAKSNQDFQSLVKGCHDLLRRLPLSCVKRFFWKSVMLLKKNIKIGVVENPHGSKLNVKLY